ncbi:MAG: glycerate kinase [Clostridia bacterium]|nr:glycerate kinase [Clostridia bacterium]
MPVFVLAPDSFKGTLTAKEVCDIFAGALLARFPEAVIHAIPMADGGEGMAENCLHLLGGQRITRVVTGPQGDPVKAIYGILPDGTAVIEMAAAAGLPLVRGKNDILRATTRGVGELLLDAAAQGASSVILGLGGSATNDCGLGMANVLGFTFTDRTGKSVPPLALHLGSITAIRAPEHPFPLPVRAACDVKNPLLGANGAAAVFAPQKGASPAEISLLEDGAARFARTLNAFCGKDVVSLPGAGAAGGMGAAAIAFLQGEFLPGAALLLEAANFDGLLKDADAVFTGEGRMDGQTRLGKVPYAVGMRCKEAGVPCYALCGSLGAEAEALSACGITAMYAASSEITDPETLRRRAADDLAALALRVADTLSF